MILISAFEPFDIDPENSTGLTLRQFLKTEPASVRGVILPVSFERAWPALKQAIDEHRPSAVIALGQADSRPKITLEQVALNLIDARILDVDGRQPRDVEIEPGPLALKSTLPNREILKALIARGLPVELSYTAGTYVCNAIMYSLVNWAAQDDTMAGFIHFPLLADQRLGIGRENVRPPRSLKLEDSVLALKTIAAEVEKKAVEKKGS